MPRGPRDENRPADVIGCAVTVARLSVGDLKENLTRPSGRLRSGYAGGKARADKLTPEKRAEIARKSAGARWG